MGDEAAGAASAVPGCRAAAKQQRTAALQCAFLWCWQQSVTVDGHASARAIGYIDTCQCTSELPKSALDFDVDDFFK